MAGLNIVTDEDQAPDPPRVSDAPAGSVLARLRARAAAQRRDRRLDVPVGGDVWGQELVIRYRMPSMEDADRLVAEAAGFADQTANPSMGRISIDLMATCATTVLGATETGELEDLDIRLTGRLLTMLELSLPPGVDDPGQVTAREVVEAVFFGNWIAINAHAARILTWLQEGGDQLGEASAAT